MVLMFFKCLGSFGGQSNMAITSYGNNPIKYASFKKTLIESVLYEVCTS